MKKRKITVLKYYKERIRQLYANQEFHWALCTLAEVIGIQKTNLWLVQFFQGKFWGSRQMPKCCLNWDLDKWTGKLLDMTWGIAGYDKEQCQKLTKIMDLCMEDGCTVLAVKGELCKKQQNSSKKWNKWDFEWVKSFKSSSKYLTISVITHRRYQIWVWM